MPDSDLTGLDFDFLRYIGVTPENQRRIQGHYLPFFAGCHRVVDLGCGDGDFITLLRERGVEATGVDSDAKACQAARARGLPVVQADACDYLAGLPAESLDGIFCAHLVEHLHYPQVMDLIAAARAALAPGGLIVLVTPDARSIFSHLEMFYLHFGHIGFYHPRLLCFLLEHAGFRAASYGANPETASPLLPAATAVRADLAGLDAILPPGDNVLFQPLGYGREIARQGNRPWHTLSFHLKRWLSNWLVKPYLDDLVANLNQRLASSQSVQSTLRRDLAAICADLQSINGPFECYAMARKPGPPPAAG